jgi:tagaturonate reductase
MIDVVNEKTGFNGSVVAVKPRAGELDGAFGSQRGLYTTVIRGVREGKRVTEFRAVTSLSRCISAYSQYDAFMGCAENPDLRFVISNTTEAGIAYNGEDRADDRPPRSFPGKLCAFLYKRYEFFHGDSAKALVLIPCELIEKNGDKLKEIVERYAREWKLGEGFTRWLEECDFCNSLVDRIVPGYPREEAKALEEELGYTDALLDAAELFYLWVIETKRDHRAELPLEQAGLNVIWTDDLSFYRTRKVRILNGAHTLSVPAAFLYGLDTVEDCIKDPLIFGLMKKGVFEEIIPSMLETNEANNTGEAEDLTRYAEDVLERFANPYIRHLLLSITLNSVSKFKARVLPSLMAYYQKKGTLPPALTFSLAALIAFYRGKGNERGELQGQRNAEPYPIKDDEGVLRRFAALYADTTDPAEPGAARKIVHAVLASEDWWGEDLAALPGLEDAVTGYVTAIWQHGIRAVLEQLVTGREG